MEYTSDEYNKEFLDLFKKYNYLRKKLMGDINKLSKQYPYVYTGSLKSDELTYLSDKKLCNVLKQYENYSKSKSLQLELFN